MATMDLENSQDSANLFDDTGPCTLASVQASIANFSRLPDARVLSTAAADEVAAMVAAREIQPWLPQLLPAAFQEVADKGVRLERTMFAVVVLLDSGDATDAAAKKVADWAIGELQALGTRPLIALLDRVLGGLGAALKLPTAPRSFHLLPTILSLLATLDGCAPTTMADGRTIVKDGDGIVAYALRTVLRTQWAAASLVPLATILRDINLPTPPRRKLVGKMSARLAEVEPTQMPALVYQLLLLADTEGKPGVLRALNAHFERVEGEAWLLVQGTVLLHVQFAVKQDQALGHAVLRQVKAGQLPLGRFSFALLLSLARVGERFHEPVVQHLAATFREAFELRAWATASPWRASATSELPPLSPEALLAHTVRTSVTASFDHIVPSLIHLAAALLDEPPKKTGGAAFGRPAKGGASAVASAGGGGGVGGELAGGVDLADADADAAAEGVEGAAAVPVAGGGAGAGARLLPVAVRMALIGRSALLDLFRLHSMVRPAVIDLIIDRLIGRGPAAGHWVAALDELVRLQPLAVLEHANRLKQLLEYVLALPPPVATAMLTSLLPLQRQRPELRDHLVLLLRKAMFSRDEPSRLTAVHGFLLLLHTTASDPAGAAGGGAGGSSTAAGGAGWNCFQLEVLGFIRRSLTQQPTIRRALYAGVVPAFQEQRHLRPMIFELLLGQLAQYTDVYEDDDMSTAALHSTPLRLDRCLAYAESEPLVEGKPPTCSIVEPLPQLIQAITRCMQAQQASNAAGAPPGADDADDDTSAKVLDGARQRMWLLITRLGACTLKHFGLHGESVLSAKDADGHEHFATASFVSATLEALLDHALLCHIGVGADEEAADGAHGRAGAPIFMPTQGHVMTACSAKANAPFPDGDPGVEAARKLFALGTSVRDKLAESKVKVGDAKRVPPAPWLPADLSLDACARVLAALLADGEASRAALAAGTQASQQGGKAATSRRFGRHVLKAIATQAAALNAELAAANGAAALGDENAAAGGGAGAGDGGRAEAIEGAGRVLGLLVALVPHAEAVGGKESPSGMRDAYVNPLTGKIEKMAKGATQPAEKPAKGRVGKGCKAAGAAAAAKKETVRSRLQLLLEALDATLCLIATHAPPGALSNALAAVVPETALSDDEVEGCVERMDEDVAEGERAAVDGVAAGHAGGGAPAAAASAVLATLTGVLLPVVERMLEQDSSDEAEAALRVARRLALTLPPTALGAVLEWVASGSCLNHELVTHTVPAQALLAFALAASRRASANGITTSLTAPLCRFALCTLGDNFAEAEESSVRRKEKALQIGAFGLLANEAHASALTAPLLEALTYDLLDLERALTVRKRLAARNLAHDDTFLDADEDAFVGVGDGAGGAGVGAAHADDGGAGTLDSAICERELAVVECLRLLCKCQLEPAHAQPLIARCVAIFKHEIQLIKWLPALPALAGKSPELPGAYTSLIAKLNGEESLCAAMYNLITYVGQMEEKSKSATRAKREARLIPELVFAVDKFEAEVVKVGVKCKVDLLRHMKRATARDFRIQVTEVETKLKMLEADRRKEARERRDKETKKRQREADKADKAADKAAEKTAGKAKVGGSNSGGKAKAAPAGSSGKKQKMAAPPPEPEEDEDESEGEDDDEYPASMIDEGSDVEDEDQ